MAIAASVITDECSNLLYDETGVRWPEAELLDYLNAGITAVLVYKPDAYVVDSTVQLATGSRQTIPADGVEFLEMINNAGSGGATPGRAIRKVDRNHLDHMTPDWHTTTGSQVLHYTFDPRNPKVFYIYPHVSTTWYARINYTGIPDRLTATSEDVPISEIYQTPLVNWVMAYAHAKNFKAGDANRSNMYLSRFNDFFGVKTTTQAAFLPTNPDAEMTDG